VIDGAELLYAGRSGNLRRRVGELAGYGRGVPIGHRGGRYLWQLAEHHRLLVGWRADDDPARAERELLEEFEERFGQLPFANLVRGARPIAVA
jgi:Ser/Thr protein kinase RdoA (MazF antagonist)